MISPSEVINVTEDTASQGCVARSTWSSGGAPTGHGSTFAQVAQVERVSRHPAGSAVADSGRLRYVPASYNLQPVGSRGESVAHEWG